MLVTRPSISRLVPCEIVSAWRMLDIFVQRLEKVYSTLPTSDNAQSVNYPQRQPPLGPTTQRYKARVC